MKELTYLLGQSPKAVIAFHAVTRELLTWSEKAEKMYGITEATRNLDPIFAPRTLEGLIGELQEENVIYFPDLITHTQSGKDQFVDLYLGYANEEHTVIYLECNPHPDRREEMAKEAISQSMNPVFMVDINEELSIYHANGLFYHIFAKNQEGFELFYKNSFVNTLVDMEPGKFLRDMRSALQEKKKYQRDIQVVNVHGVKKWFYVELYHLPFENGVGKIRGMMIPISDRMEVAKQLEHMNQYLAAIQEVTEGALFYLHPKGKMIHHSKLLKNMGFANEVDDCLKAISPILHPEEKETVLDYGRRLLEGSEETFRFRYLRGDEEYSWAKVRGMGIRDNRNNIVEVVAHIENMDAEMQLVERATVDPLTNALNKEVVQGTVEDILEKTDRNTRHALFFMDLDNFKYVNDNLGHKFGDFLLSELGKRMEHSVRRGDIIGRVGGDEFVILIRNIPSFEMLHRKARQLLSTIGEEFNDGAISHVIGGSIGVAVFPEHGDNYTDLYHHADMALYRSKHRGKNMATIYQSEV